MKRSPTMRQLMRYVEDGEYALVNSWIDKNTLGMICEDKKAIYLNVYLMIAIVYIHEVMHDVYPHTAEELINEAVDRRIKRLKVDEIVQLARDVFSNMEDGYLTGHKPKKKRS